MVLSVSDYERKDAMQERCPAFTSYSIIRVNYSIPSGILHEEGQ